MKRENAQPTAEEIEEIYRKRKIMKTEGSSKKLRAAAISKGICPDCGAPLVKGKLSGGSMGVGQAYCQASMPSFEVCYERICSKCGLVVGKGSYHVNQ